MSENLEVKKFESFRNFEIFEIESLDIWKYLSLKV